MNMNPAKEEIISLLKKETGLEQINLEIPPDSKLGDYAFPCFMLSKTLKKNPVEIAKEFAEKIKPSGLIKEVKEAGPYLNFFVNKQALAGITIKEALKPKYAKGRKKKEKIMVEFVSPNTNKSLHLGHVRNGLLGVSLCNLLNFYGYNVVKTCLNNDRGAGMCEAMLGYRMFHNGETPNIKSDHFVSKCYVDFKKAENEKPGLKDETEKLLLKWEAEEPEVRILWKKMVEWVTTGYKYTYNKLGISFDKQYFESDIYKQGKEIVAKGLENGIFEKKEGAVTAMLEPYSLPNKVLIKSDGTSLYITQDIYLAELKENEFHMDRSIYIVGSEQDMHFKQMFKILELLKFKNAKKCYHLSYGLVNLPSGRMKSREGTVVDADELIDEVVKLAKHEIRKRHDDLSEEEVNKRANIIGMGALKFFMLKFDNVTSFTYNPEESLSFEGETGPYVQYVHARICSILEKYGKKVTAKIKPELLNSKEDEKVVLLLSKFPEIVEEAGEHYKPYLLARYLIELSQAFNEFYHNCPILQSDYDIKLARLNLIFAVKNIIKTGLNLLGIDAPEKM